MPSSCDVVMVRRGNPSDSPSPVTIHGLPVWDRLAAEVHDRGHRFWRDVSAAELDGRPVALLWDFGSAARLPKKLLDRAEGRVLAWCLESPLVAGRAFRRLAGIARESRVVTTFEGARPIVERAGGRFDAIRYPVDLQPAGADTSWDERRLVVMISSNKSLSPRLADLDVTNPIGSARRVAASVLSRSHALLGSWRAPDLYRARAAAFARFGEKHDADLFGSGWRHSIPGVSPADAEVIRSRYKGPVADKRAVLGRYRFCLCFENTSFPGYITEKIFDCFLCGTVPIYRGAPDVAAYIPRDCFIDASSTDATELVDKVSSMPEREWRTYREASDRFLTSSLIEDFSHDSFVELMCRALEEVAAA